MITTKFFVGDAMVLIQRTAQGTLLTVSYQHSDGNIEGASVSLDEDRVLEIVQALQEDVADDESTAQCQYCGIRFVGAHVIHVIRECRGSLLSESEARAMLGGAESPAPALMATRRLSDLGVSI